MAGLAGHLPVTGFSQKLYKRLMASWMIFIFPLDLTFLEKS
jgi:hypothetical protein